MSDEAPPFFHSATLRIWGDIPDLDAISRRLGLVPTHVHRKGEKGGPRSQAYQHDQWSYTAPVKQDRPLEEHLLALWEAVRYRITTLKSLKRTLKVDVLCVYRSNSETAGFQLGHDGLEMFVKLEVPFGVSVIGRQDEGGDHDSKLLDSTASRSAHERSGRGSIAHEREALFRAVCEHPWDDAVRLVYADWLEEHGQPERAAFIRFQIESKELKRDDLSSEEMEPDNLYWERYREFDSLRSRWEKELPALPGVKWSWSFERGFIADVTFRSPKAFCEHAEAVFAASPIDDIRVEKVSTRTIGGILGSPLLARLRGLHLDGTLNNEGVRLVAACPSLMRLESLAIWGGGFDDAAAEAIAHSPYLGSLKGLNFSGGRIGDRGALALAESPNLSGVTWCVLDGERELSRPVIKKLKKRFQNYD
jgi:uncharacterized protein (TIGR02996 family)